MRRSAPGEKSRCRRSASAEEEDEDEEAEKEEEDEDDEEDEEDEEEDAMAAADGAAPQRAPSAGAALRRGDADDRAYELWRSAPER